MTTANHPKQGLPLSCQLLLHTTQPELGAELWAYVPYNLLPHLYWLTEAGYKHIYYVDQKPRVFDAKIFTPDAVHPQGWGTVMVVGMRFGGAAISTDMNKAQGNTSPGATDVTMKSAFIIMDITDPEAPPKLLGEIVMPRMGFSTSYPTVVIMKDGNQDKTYGDYEAGENRWFLAFGSGPADWSGNPEASVLQTAGSNQNGRLYMVDLVKLARDNQLWSLGTDTNPLSPNRNRAVNMPGLHAYFTLPEPNSFVSDPVTVDFERDYNADVLYYGTVSGSRRSASVPESGWKGQLRRVVIDGRTDPANWGKTDSEGGLLMDAGQPVTAAPTPSVDEQGNNWVFFGTGRYLVINDTEDEDLQAYYGIKEPVTVHPVTESKSKNWSRVEKTALVDVSAYRVFPERPRSTMVHNGSKYISWQDVLDEQNGKGGWFLNFNSPDRAGERNVGQADLSGGALVFTTFVPSLDACIAGGVSYLWAVYYKTGTAYPEPIIGTIYRVLPSLNGEVGLESARDILIGSGIAISADIQRQEQGKITAQTSEGGIFQSPFGSPNENTGRSAWEVVTP